MTRSLRTVRAAGLALALAVVWTPHTQAHAPSPVFVGDALFAQELDLTFDWSDAQMPILVFRDAVKAGAADSNASRGSRAPTFRGKDGASNIVAYGTDVVCGTGGLACMRRNPPGWFGLWFRENGHAFDWGALKWCQLYAAPTPSGCFDVENITLDELGHVLILDHHENLSDQSDYLDSVVQTVSHAKPQIGWNAHAFGRCDVAQLQRQYDVLTTSKISTCLDIPTSVTLTTSVTTIPYDGTVRFTAHLEALNDPTVTWRLRATTSTAGRSSSSGARSAVPGRTSRRSPGQGPPATTPRPCASGPRRTGESSSGSRPTRVSGRSPGAPRGSPSPADVPARRARCRHPSRAPPAEDRRSERCRPVCEPCSPSPSW